MDLNSDKYKDIIKKTIIWNTIIETFFKEKNIDLTPYLISIKINNNKILIKTNKPLINNELIIIQDKIIINLSEKLKKI
jgi:hypothetical protein